VHRNLELYHQSEEKIYVLSRISTHQGRETLKIRKIPHIGLTPLTREHRKLRKKNQRTTFFGVQVRVIFLGGLINIDMLKIQISSISIYN
jgi:hypothetical protein